MGRANPSHRVGAMNTLSRLVAASAAVAALALGAAHADPPVVPSGLVAEPAGEVLDLTPPTLPGRPTPPSVTQTLCDEPGAWFATGEVLLWRPRLGDAAFALVDPRADLAPMGRVKDVSLDARAGLRVGAGYRFAGSGWGVGLTYTHFASSGSQDATAPTGGVVYPLLNRPGIVDRAARLTGTARLDYDLFDLDFSKAVAVDPHLTLRPFAGVRFADIDTCLGAAAAGLLAQQAVVRSGSGFQGAGPTAGAEAAWTVTRRLSLFGTARGGLLFGTFDGYARETNANGAVLLADVADRFSSVAPMVSVGLGASYRWRTVSVAAGYEVTHWFGAVTRPSFTDDFADGRVARRRSDLSLDGVYLRLGVEY